MIFDYECTKCKKIEEVVCSYDSKEKFKCSDCKSIMKRILSPVSFVLQGKGFYGRGRT